MFGEHVAVDDVSFVVPPGGSLAIVGESGSGKTTIARMIVGLERPTAGTIASAAATARSRRARRASGARAAREVQIVFQDPYSSLDPRQTAATAASTRCCGSTAAAAAERDAQRVDELAEHGRPRRPPAARAAARAIGRPAPAGRDRPRPRRPSRSSLILDEAVAALDVSIQAQVLNLLADIREATGVSYVLISHDLAVVRQLTDEAS